MMGNTAITLLACKLCQGVTVFVWLIDTTWLLRPHQTAHASDQIWSQELPKSSDKSRLQALMFAPRLKKDWEIITILSNLSSR